MHIHVYIYILYVYNNASYSNSIMINHRSERPPRTWRTSSLRRWSGGAARLPLNILL